MIFVTLQRPPSGAVTHQQNKQFNTYKEGLDLEFVRKYSMEHGKVFSE